MSDPRHERFLVIRRDNIGDLVCTTPMIAALRARYPEAHIAALVNSYNAAAVRGNPDLDAVFAYTKLKHRMPGQSALGILIHRLRLLSALRRARYDYVILAKSGFDRYGLALARQVRPRQIVGFVAESGPTARGITLPVSPVPFHRMHEVEVMMKLVAPLDVTDAPGPLRVFAPAEEVAKWRKRLPELDRQERRWVGLHVSAREPGREWPAERFARVARKLIDAGLGVVLLWSPGEADDRRHPGDDAKAREIVALCPEAGLLPAPTLQLEDLMAALSLCAAFIGCDGGAMHLAAGLGLPIVALFENRPEKKLRWYPWGVPYELVSAPTRDIADIDVSDVLQAWERLARRFR